MIFRAFPKVNVFLKIVGQDENGYHLLDSRFCLALGKTYDLIEVRESGSFVIKGDFDCSLESNLMYRAIATLRNYLGETRGRILNFLNIEVEKRIPVGAGLGGGSADAGMLLYHLNQEYFNIPDEKMYEIARILGADVSFFYSQAKSANVYGVGELIEVFEEDLLEFEIFTPEISCNTKEVYCAYDDYPHNHLSSYVYRGLSDKTSLEILKTHDRFELNDLLAPALMRYSDLSVIEQGLGHEWFFSGSGSSFFRIRKTNQTSRMW